MDGPILVATEVHQGLIIKNRKGHQSTIKTWTESIYIQVFLRSKNKTDQSVLLERPSFPPMSCLNFLGSLFATFKKCHSLNQPTLFSRKCLPMALTVSFFKSPTFLACTKVQFSLVHSLPLHVKSTHTNSAIPLGKMSEAFMSGLLSKNIPISITLCLVDLAAPEQWDFFKCWIAGVIALSSEVTAESRFAASLRHKFWVSVVGEAPLALVLSALEL